MKSAINLVYFQLAEQKRKSIKFFAALFQCDANSEKCQMYFCGSVCLNEITDVACFELNISVYPNKSTTFTFEMNLNLFFDTFHQQPVHWQFWSWWKDCPHFCTPCVCTGKTLFKTSGLTNSKKSVATIIYNLLFHFQGRIYEQILHGTRLRLPTIQLYCNFGERRSERIEGAPRPPNWSQINRKI